MGIAAGLRARLLAGTASADLEIRRLRGWRAA
jgi:hypothetical protein